MPGAIGAHWLELAQKSPQTENAGRTSRRLPVSRKAIRRLRLTLRAVGVIVNTSKATKGCTMDAVNEALKLIGQAEALLAQAPRQLTQATGAPSRLPYMDAKTALRVEKLGEVAYRHQQFIEDHGSMTRADSLLIRRELYGEDVQATANLFGRKGSRALFWRDRPHGTPVKDDDPIRLTEEGARIADLWSALHCPDA